MCLLACLLSVGEASKSFWKRFQKLTQSRGRDLNDQQCAMLGFQIFSLTSQGGACEGLDTNTLFESDSGVPDLTNTCGGCNDALKDAFRDMYDAGCMDGCDAGEIEHMEDVCVLDCSSNSSLCASVGDTSDPYTCQSGLCLPADGSTPEADNPEAIFAMLDFACVTHPDGEYCFHKMEFLMSGNITGSCDQFEGLGCCYGWAKKRTLIYISIVITHTHTHTHK